MTSDTDARLRELAVKAADVNAPEWWGWYREFREMCGPKDFIALLDAKAAAEADRDNSNALLDECRQERNTLQKICAKRADELEVAERELARAREALRDAERVVAAAHQMPRRTPGPGSASTEHDFKIEAGVVWQLDAALTAYDKSRAALSGAADGDGA